MTTRADLEAGLSEAQAALSEAVINAARFHGNNDEANLAVRMRRTDCRKWRTALDQWKRTDSTSVPPEHKGSRNAHEQGHFASEGAIGGAVSPFLVPADALARQSLLRQSIGLLALALAFLHYQHLDTRLQIISLTSIFAGTSTAALLGEPEFAGKRLASNVRLAGGK